jgi:restriction system protein
MAIPTYEDCMLPFLKAIADGQQHSLRNLIEKIADALSLSAEDRVEMLPSGQRVIANRVGWARTYLKKAGLIESPKRGVMQLTQRGREVLAGSPNRIDSAYLKERFGEFREWIQAKPLETVSADRDASSTPEEIMDGAYNELRDQVASELLDTLKGCSPYFFEKVVVDLLRAMGYGGVGGRGLVTPKSRDGGVDGVIYEDKLCLDSVCIQAKRWEGTVGRKTVQEFVGSMDLHRSRKGVILSTSAFSRDAIEYVERIEGKKVVLIDDDQLTRLMIEHRVGVTPTRSYELVAVSQDFFDEET